LYCSYADSTCQGPLTKSTQIHRYNILCKYVQTQKENKQNFKISHNALKLIKELDFRGGRLVLSCKVLC